MPGSGSRRPGPWGAAVPMQPAGPAAPRAMLHRTQRLRGNGRSAPQAIAPPAASSRFQWALGSGAGTASGKGRVVGQRLAPQCAALSTSLARRHGQAQGQALSGAGVPTAAIRPGQCGGSRTSPHWPASRRRSACAPAARPPAAVARWRSAGRRARGAGESSAGVHPVRPARRIRGWAPGRRRPSRCVSAPRRPPRHMRSGMLRPIAGNVGSGVGTI